MAGGAAPPALFKLFRPYRWVHSVDPRLVPSINSDIKTLVQQGQHLNALQLYIKEPCFPWNATKFTFPSLLKASASLLNVRYGETIHATIFALGLQFDPYIVTSLINMYVKCGSLINAVQLFDTVLINEVLMGDVTVWNSILDGYLKNGYMEEGLSWFRQMQILGTKPDKFSMSIVLRVSSDHLRYKEGKQVHGYIVRNMFLSDSFVGTALVNMYAHFGRPMNAWHVFSELDGTKNIATWSAMIGGFGENQMWKHCFELYRLLKYESFSPDSASFSSLLTTCSHGQYIEFGDQLHCDITKMGFGSDPYACTSLITMYGKCSLVEDAERVFHFSSKTTTEMWNAVISANIDNGCVYDALKIYHQMRLSAISSDSFTISNLLTGCYTSGLFDFGLMLHGELMKRPMQHNIRVQSSLIMTNSTRGSIEDAMSVFYSMREKDAVAWGSLISALCQNMKFEEAMDFFRTMRADSVKPDAYILENVINACKGLNNLKSGYAIHGFVITSGLSSDHFVICSLIDMYSACGSSDMVENVFSGIVHNSLVIWNSMISFYCRNGLPNKAINLFSEMIKHGSYPDFVTITKILVAISSVAAFLKGKAIHGYVIKHELSNLQVDNALIDMYLKCGRLTYSERLFHNLPRRTLISWNLMIAGYGSHGKCLQALNLFSEMKKLGIKPDGVTFLSLISACAHSGLVSEGLKLFNSMEVEYKIEPKVEHYVKVIDLLGRAGCLADSYNFIQKMHIKPDRNVWLCLLSACKAHRNVELGELAAHELLKMDPFRGSNYVQLLNIYEESGLKDKAMILRAKMRQEGLKKSPGCSWIELRDKVSTFFSGDMSSPGTIEMHEMLGNLKRNMEKQRVFYEVVNAY